MATRTMGAPAGAGLSLQRCSLVEVEGPTPGNTIELGSGRTVIGKSPDCDVPIADVTVSRQHFAILNDGQRYLIKDLGSTNGTLLDGAEVKEAYLRPGATIKAGEVVFRFQTEYDPVQIKPSDRDSFGGLLGRSLRMREIFALLEKVAPTDATLLLTGSTGTGKGEAVRALHDNSKRRKGPLVVVDCGAVARTLIESELFGHVKGAFTGATGLRKGALEISKGGTLFIDELDDLPLDLQPKLLRALEERIFVRLGSNQPIKFDARVVAASKKDLWKAAGEGTFREDLYFRLSVVAMHLPALRERAEDIPLLFDRFASKAGLKFADLPATAQDRWMHHPWPGNVRELRNAVERSLAIDGDGLVAPSGPQDGQVGRVTGLVPEYALPFKQAKEKLIDAFEREYIRRLMARATGGVAGAARQAGIDRKHLYKLMEKHGLGRSDLKKKGS
ncbi:MAG: sigma 54-dependent Fis family transcriptional regulator [Deltaproteobacteria bacterium]|nr:sigma 54-dependent Fis family transcriptional regulator [Deltaproteobacteria bacterium]